MKSQINSELNFWCSRHGEAYPAKKGSSYTECPKCKYVRENNLCTWCESHKASVPFANSSFEGMRFGPTPMCKCCYFKRVEKALQDTQENYNKLKAELDLEPCYTEGSVS